MTNQATFPELREAQNLHGAIMNLQSGAMPTLPIVGGQPKHREELAYRIGHRDARHDAAELALAADARIDAQAAEIERLREGVELWRFLYRRAINEANGLTNYVEERPELRRAERNLTAIEADARAALEQTK